MRNAKLIVVFCAAHISLTGWAAVPDKSELEKLSGKEVRDLIVGNTYTYKAEWGRWADYILAGGTGYAKAWGDSWSQTATSEYDIKTNGEWCATYNGDADWANPEYEYCAMLYSDGNGSYYKETTADPRVPENVGQFLAFDVKPGDEYGLSE